MFGRWHRTRKYIIGLDLEKVSGAGFTGMSTKSGDLMTLSFRDCDVTGLGGSTPQQVFCIVSLIFKILGYKLWINYNHNPLKTKDLKK